MEKQIGSSSWVQCIEDMREGQSRLPELRSAFADLILVHHPETPLVEGSIEQKSMIDHEALYDFAYFGKPHYAWAMFSHPELRVSLPMNDGNFTEIRLISSAFPVDDSRIDKVTFIFKFPELGLNCTVGAGSKTCVTSISRDSEAFTMHTPTGSQIRSWPKWTRAITGTDINEITTILQREGLIVVAERRRVLRGYISC